MIINATTKFGIGDLVHVTVNRVACERGDTAPFLGQVTGVRVDKNARGVEVRYMLTTANAGGYEGEFLVDEVCIESATDDVLTPQPE